MELTETILKLSLTHCSTETDLLNQGVVMPLQPNTADSPALAPTLSLSHPDGGRNQGSICADRATGKHYGIASCDGCKGFFRRSIRKNHTYSCRFDRKCSVDKDRRNQCRYCRLQECFKAGMRKEVLASPASHVVSTKRTAGMGNVFQSMKQQLLLLVEWAKHIPEFCNLPLDDRVTLLRTHSAEHLILGATRCSLPYNDVILLGNDFVITLRDAQIEVSRVAFRTQEELIKPLRKLDITAGHRRQRVCLPHNHFLFPSLESPRLVRDLQFQTQLLLEQVTCEKRERFGELLLIMPPLQSVAWQLVETLHLARLLGEAQMDSLLLGEGAKEGNGLCTANDDTHGQESSSPT